MAVKRFLVVPLLLVAACKPPSPADQMDAILSWVATARMTGDAWLQGTTPDKYTRQTLEQSQQMLQQTGSELLKSPPPSIDSAALDSLLARSRSHIAEMARRVKEKNAPGFRVPWDSLRVDLIAVKQFSDRVEAAQ